MVGALALVGVVGIIAVTILLLVWTDRRRTARRELLSQTAGERNIARAAIARFRFELSVQTAAQVFDPQAFQTILDDYDKEIRP